LCQSKGTQNWEYIYDRVGTNCKEKEFKFVGHVLDDRLTWVGHVEHLSKKLAGANFAINASNHFLPLNIRKMLYYSLFYCHINFGRIAKQGTMTIIL
jgi:hypothetical protein